MIDGEILLPAVVPQQPAVIKPKPIKAKPAGKISLKKACSYARAADIKTLQAIKYRGLAGWGKFLAQEGDNDIMRGIATKSLAQIEEFMGVCREALAEEAATFEEKMLALKVLATLIGEQNTSGRMIGQAVKRYVEDGDSKPSQVPTMPARQTIVANGSQVVVNPPAKQ